MLPNLGFTEIIILVGILVLFFGAKRIPEIGSSIGKGIKAFQRGLKEEPKEPRMPEETPDSAPPPSASSGGAPKRLNQ
jgi:sec-independent protein translocase protein TatA